MFGDDGGGATGDIADDDSLSGGRGQMNGVVTDAADGDHFQLRQGLQDVFGEAEAAAGIEQDISVLQPSDLCGWRLWPIEVQADVCELFELWQQR